MSAARLCYGDPVRAGDHAIVPVARMRAAGGFGSNPRAPGEAAERDLGGGGAMSASPVGFIDVGPKGVRYEGISDRGQVARALAGLAVAGGAVAVALARESLARRLGAVRRRRARSGRR